MDGPREHLRGPCYVQACPFQSRRVVGVIRGGCRWKMTVNPLALRSGAR